MTLTTNSASNLIKPGTYAPRMEINPPETLAVIPQPGQSAVFQAWAVGQPAPTIQWEVSIDNEMFAPIPEATDATYVIPEVTSEVNNYYRATFTNDSGSVSSSSCQLVLAAPVPG